MDLSEKISPEGHWLENAPVLLLSFAAVGLSMMVGLFFFGPGNCCCSFVIPRYTRILGAWAWNHRIYNPFYHWDFVRWSLNIICIVFLSSLLSLELSIYSIILVIIIAITRICHIMLLWLIHVNSPWPFKHLYCLKSNYVKTVKTPLFALNLIPSNHKIEKISWVITKWLLIIFIIVAVWLS